MNVNFKLPAVNFPLRNYTYSQTTNPSNLNHSQKAHFSKTATFKNNIGILNHCTTNSHRTVEHKIQWTRLANGLLSNNNVPGSAKLPGTVHITTKTEVV